MKDNKRDQRYTCLWDKKIVSKSDDIIDAIGCIDKLIAWLTIVLTCELTLIVRVFVELIQEWLIMINGELVGSKKYKPINQLDVEILLDEIAFLEKRVKKPKGWWTKGNKSASHLNYARVLTRDVERKIVALLNNKSIENATMINFFNRLSKYLYTAQLYEDQK